MSKVDPGDFSRPPPQDARVDVPAAAANEGRRRFLATGGAAALTFSAWPVAPAGAGQVLAGEGKAVEAPEAKSSDAFRERAYAVRVAAANACRDAPVLAHPDNGDEARYANLIGSDSRGLPHNQRGEVDPAAYRAALKAYASGDPADYEAIPLGGTRKQANPIGTLAVSLSGLNTTQFAIPPAPALASAQRAGEAVELYWQSLLRDVPFSELRNDTGNKKVVAAVDELNRLSAFDGPRADGRVTPETLFRGTALYVDKSDASGRTGRYVTPPGTLAGPYISQFLLRDVPFGAQFMSARMRTTTPDSEFLTNYDEWLSVQNGKSSGKSEKFDDKPRFIANGRDLAKYVHNNPAMVSAAAMLLGNGPDKANPAYGGFGTALSATNPYLKSKTQGAGPPSFGIAYVLGLLPYITARAVRVAYWHKFHVHRTLRPEAYAGLVHHRVANKVDDYPVHPEVLNSQALARSAGEHGTYLLSHTYPEGSPVHSSYPGGASSIAGSSVTVLKAFFDEDAVIANPMQPDPNDPSRLVAYQGPPLTVGGELNKLALNYAFGRDWSGIHWRSDAAASLAIGEDLAISVLRDERTTYREAFDGFRFTRFDGSKVSV